MLSVVGVLVRVVGAPCAPARVELIEAFFEISPNGLPASRVSPRRATYFSLSRQRNLRKRKATRLSGFLRCATGNLRCSNAAGVGRTRFAQTLAALDTASICAARPSQTGFRDEADSGRRGRAKRDPAGARSRSRPEHPSRWAEERRQKRIRAGTCLSEASLCLIPLLSSIAGCPAAQRRGPRPSGRLLFAYFLLATQEKVSRPPGRDPACRQTAATAFNHTDPLSQGYKC